MRGRGAGTFRSPERPAFTNSGQKEYSAPAGAGHFWLQPQKWPKTLLETAGFKTSCAAGHGIKRCRVPRESLNHCKSSYNESLAVLLSLPLLRFARRCAGLPPWRLSNRALAAFCGKCRCGPSGRRIQNYVGCKALPCTAREKKVFARDAGAAAGIGVQAIRCGTFLHRSYNWTKGKSKNRRFLAAFFSIFLSLLKEIWPPEAEKQDAGATRNRRTENGPSGTPAPTEG